MNTMTLWIARDKVGILHAFNVKPTRVDETWKVDTSIPKVNSFEELKEKMPLRQSMVLFSELFPNLKWEDEPIQVELNDIWDADDKFITVGPNKYPNLNWKDEPIECDGDLSELEDGSSMFKGSTSLTTFTSDMPHLTDGWQMFLSCTSLKSFKSDLSSLKEGFRMFEDCSSLQSFTSDLSSLTKGRNMFQNCSSLTTFTSDLSHLMDGEYMFANCTSLSFFKSDLNSLIGGCCMFYKCSALTSFESDLSHLMDGEYMFHGCTSLQSVKIKCTKWNKSLITKKNLSICNDAVLEVSTNNGQSWEIINE